MHRLVASRRRALLASALCLASLLPIGCDSGEDIPGQVVVDPSSLDFGVIVAGAGEATRRLRIENVGGDHAILWEAVLSARESACGTFVVEGEAFLDLKGGQSGTVDVRFIPRKDAPGGCGCVAVADLRLTFDAAPWDVVVPLVARGACDQPVRCLPLALELPDALVGEARTRKVTCWNVEPAEVAIESMRLRTGGDEGFTVGAPDPTLPATLGQGQGVSIPVSFSPPDAGDYESGLEVHAGGCVVAVPVSATAQRRFPRCSEGIPPDPEPLLQTAEYTVILEDTPVSVYGGIIRSRWYYDDTPPLVADVLLATGAFTESQCPCGQTGHKAWCQSCGQGEGDRFYNIHAFPMDEQVETWVRRIAVWDDLSIRGWEVLKIDYPNGSWWQDAGCNTLIITWICENQAAGGR